MIGYTTFIDSLLWGARIDEWWTGNIWNEAIVAYFRHYSSICFEGVRKATKSLSQGSWCPGPDAKRALSEYDSGALLLDQPARFYTVTWYIDYRRDLDW
jgi:hypothetical protein